MTVIEPVLSVICLILQIVSANVLKNAKIHKFWINGNVNVRQNGDIFINIFFYLFMKN